MSSWHVSDEEALKIACPSRICEAKPGVWCRFSVLGPWMHQARYEKIRKQKEREMSKFSDTNDYGYGEGNRTVAMEDIETEQVAQDISKAEHLAMHLQPKTHDPFENGDVIKFKVNPGGGAYTYAALKAGGQYYVTGRSSLVERGPISFKRFVDLLNRDDVSDIEYSTGWAKVQ